MQTVIEHPTFIKQAAKIWAEDELHAFIDWIAANPLAGDVIQGSKAGARKVRWQASGRGKRGGARVTFTTTWQRMRSLFWGWFTPKTNVIVSLLKS